MRLILKSRKLTTSRSLLALPNELLALIIGSDDLTIKDLANLRLTCKHIKHFASSTLGRRIFVDLNIWFTCDALNWFVNLMLSGMGNHVRSVSLAGRKSQREKFYPSKYYGFQEAEVKSKYSQLQDITIKRCIGAAYSWQKVIHAATHLRTFELADPEAFSAGESWFGVYKHTFDQNDNLLGSIKSDLLSSLTLVHLHILVGVLKRLLDIHKKTLFTLEIRECILVGGSWSEVLDWIRSNLSDLRLLYIDVRHEAYKKVPAPEQYASRQLNLESYLELSPYSLSTCNSPFDLIVRGHKKIYDGLTKLLEA